MSAFLPKGYRLTASKKARYPDEILRNEATGLSLPLACALAREYTGEGWDVTIDGPGDVVRFPAE